MKTSERVLLELTRLLPRECVEPAATAHGAPAAPLAAPRTNEEAAEVVRLARAERWTILPAGNGSKLGWARAPQRVDLVLSSRNLSGVVAYEPADGTLTARAGTSFAELVARTAERHHLAPELAAPERATLGGALGAGANGFDRLRHGPLRHQVLGLLALHADGSFVKSGGRVVKNVTGYDLHRLWCGSQGTLCFLLEATLRLYPAPTEVAVLRTRCAQRGDALVKSHALLRTALVPLAVVLRTNANEARVGNGVGHDVELDVVLSGRAEAVADEIATLQPLLGASELLRGAEARRARAQLVAAEHEDGTWAPLVLSCRPSRLPGALERLERAARELALAPRLLCHPLLAQADVRFAGAQPAAAQRAALTRALSDAELTLRWRAPASGTPAPPAAAHALMERLKRSLDPESVFVHRPFEDAP